MQAVIFDVDGVLVDSEPLFYAHLQLFLVERGVADPTQVSHGALKGLNSLTMSQLMVDSYALDIVAEDFSAQHRAAYFEHLSSLEHIPEIPGVTMFVKQLAKSGHPLAIASGASQRRIDFFLQKLQLASYFSVIVCGDEVEHPKPAPDIFLLAAERLGEKPANCVVVEDAENGVRAAKAAGMRCIAYGGSVHNTDNLLAADLVVKDSTALVQALKPGHLPV
jgi:HAD superfamily hydrolase (TIGR01509 family)